MVFGAGFLAFGLVSLFSAAVDAQTAGVCSGQSCYVASLSGSTNEPYTMKNGKKPTGGNAMGDNCIKNAYKQLKLPPPQGLRFVDIMQFKSLKNRALRDEVQDNLKEFYDKVRLNKIAHDEIDEGLEKRQAGCKENTLMFGRGTTEGGTMGGTVGPALQSALGTKGGWSVQGIAYSADLSGIYCIGMAGGLKCINQINKLAAACPKTNIVLSGYSQGAMVARICAAFADEAAKKQIKGLALFGDPFNGATVKGIDPSKVKTWCNKGDGVCKGDFSIGAAHLSYVGSSTSAAVSWIQSIVKS